MPISRETVVDALRRVKDPELFKDIITLNMVNEIAIDADRVTVRIQQNSPNGPGKDTMESAIIRSLKEIGAGEVVVIFRNPAPKSASPRSSLPQVRNVIAVGAGKGGVGKSTVAVNLAVALQRQGASVGLMDGDIYGPSIPTMLGIKGVQPKLDNNKIVPHAVHGIHAITIGSLVESDKPLIWRGPMAHGAFKQLLLDNTQWPALDYLIVDLPPGTGDVPLTLCQLLPVTGAVIVATPQQVALDDAIRAVKMFEQLGAPILGLIENMSYFVAPDGTEHDIFGRGGTRRAAEALELTCLGEIPMFTELRINSDQGRPHANFEGNITLKNSLQGIASALVEKVNQRNQQSSPTLEIL